MDTRHLPHKYLLVGGHRLAYLDEGSGPPVLLIHGIPTSSLLWCGGISCIDPSTAAAGQHSPLALSHRRTGCPQKCCDTLGTATTHNARHQASPGFSMSLRECAQSS
jgi:pimeloyl-ACP methyl ester carboxylesterase